jgi:hypothetical protein
MSHRWTWMDADKAGSVGAWQAVPERENRMQVERRFTVGQASSGTRAGSTHLVRLKSDLRWDFCGERVV